VSDLRSQLQDTLGDTYTVDRELGGGGMSRCASSGNRTRPYDGPNGNCAICIYDDLGLAWRRAGVVDSAIYYWEKYLTTPYYGREGFDAGQSALMHKWLGELYEGKGDVRNAARHYTEFVRRWEHADAKLQPKVQEVRRRLARLADVERK